MVILIECSLALTSIHNVNSSTAMNSTVNIIHLESHYVY